MTTVIQVHDDDGGADASSAVPAGQGYAMNSSTRNQASSPPGAAYGFYCTLGKTAFADPVAVMQLTDDPEVAKVADEVRSRLERVRSALAPAPDGATKL